MTTRRSFTKRTAAVLTAPLIFPQLGWPANKNSRVQHACIGVGGMGGNDFANFLAHPKTDIVAICDVDANAARSAAAKAAKARQYADWRLLFEQEGDKIDSVNVAVPDHMHASIVMTALQRKKHAYCQKPMCHDVAEVRALNEVSARHGLVTQLGTQHASGSGDRMAVQWMREKLVGKVQRVLLCSNRSSGMAYRRTKPRPANPDPVPANLDWDLWLGTAPSRPFNKDIYHPAMWRTWQDFGTGWSGDIGCHIFDAVWKGLSLQPPKSVVAKTVASFDDPAVRKELWSAGNHITWEMPGTEFTDGDFSLEWFDGVELYPPAELMKIYTDPATGWGETKFPEEAAMVVGTEGTLVLPHSRAYALLHPKAKFAKIEKPKFDGRNHYHHFLDAILGTVKNESHFQQTGPMTEAILLGTVAIRMSGTKLAWDHQKMTTDNATANTLLRRTYRDGWKIEGLG
ncbi:MAG: Gfo/Idh/MocA family oxidoreductase [Verrucomicrobiales bacterium]|nr:Gfo/Idh/MocA family oxidoreductase [Verrucomicrobiales bacterium]